MILQVRLKCLATIAGLYWKTADVTLSQEHPKLLQTRDGIFPFSIFSHFSFFHILVSTCVGEGKCGVFVGNSEFVFPFVLPLPLVMLSVSSAADTNRKV